MQIKGYHGAKDLSSARVDCSISSALCRSMRNEIGSSGHCFSLQYIRI